MTLTPSSTLLGPPDEPCASCASALAVDQRYCLECGARRGPARLDPLAYARGDQGTAGSTGAQVATGDAPAWAALPPAALALGRPRVAATSAAIVLAAGALLGAAVLPDTQVAAAGRVLLAAVPQAAAPADAPASEPGTTSADAPADAALVDAGTAADVAPGPASTGDAGTGAPADPGAGSPTASDPAPAPASASPAPVKHVWVLALEGVNVATAGGAPTTAGAPAVTAASAHASAETPSAGGLPGLRASGTVLTGYRSVARGSLANAVALISGQTPTPAQADGCATYSPIAPGTVTKTGLVRGDGCVEPPQVVALTDRLTGAGAVWRAYAQDIGAGPADRTSCRHPELGAADPYLAPRPGDAYLTWRNPFVYFRSITESADCGSAVVGLDRLAPDLGKAADTPAFSYLSPDACHDGSPTPCAPGAPAGDGAASAWLDTVVPEIQASPAYADGGLIVVTSPDGPRPRPDTAGGVPVGAILLSPYVAAGATVPTAYDHLSLLRTLALIFGVDAPGRAATAAVKPFDAKVFANAPAAGGD